MRLSHFDVSPMNILLAAVHPVIPVSLPLLCAGTIKNLDLSHKSAVLHALIRKTPWLAADGDQCAQPSTQLSILHY